MAYLRIRGRKRGYFELAHKVRFLERAEFMQGAGLLLKRSTDFYVDGKDGNDNHNGLSMDRAFKTIEAAITAMNARISWAESPWARGDICYIAPGTYAEVLTSLAHGVTFIGLGHDVRDAQNGVKIKPVAGSPVNVGAVVNSAFYNIGFESPDASPAFDAEILNNCHFENCFFSGAAESVACTEALITLDATKTTFKDCWFCNAGYGLRFKYADANDKAAYVLIDGCIITGIGTCGIHTSTNLVGPHSVIKNTHIGGGGQTLTTGINDLSHLFEVIWSTIEASTAIGGSGAPRSVNGSYGLGVLLT